MSRRRAPRPAAAPAGKAWFVYMLECAGGRIYTGITPDVARRFAAHGAGRGGAFTRSHKPLRVIAAKACGTRGDALRAEYALKQLRRAAKLAWARRSPWVASVSAEYVSPAAATAPRRSPARRQKSRPR